MKVKFKKLTKKIILNKQHSFTARFHHYRFNDLTLLKFNNF